MTFEFLPQKIPEVLLIKPEIFVDNRGSFNELIKKSVFKENGIKCDFLQDNISFSSMGVLRGLHFQTGKYVQAKLVTVVAGKVMDVAVDLRPSSPTYKDYVSVVLDAKSRSLLFVPEGFAHGFCSLEDNTILIYKNSNEYSPKNDSGIIWNDSTIGISWPIENPILSDKDRNLQTFLEFQAKIFD